MNALEIAHTPEAERSSSFIWPLPCYLPARVACAHSLTGSSTICGVPPPAVVILAGSRLDPLFSLPFGHRRRGDSASRRGCGRSGGIVPLLRHRRIGRRRRPSPSGWGSRSGEPGTRALGAPRKTAGAGSRQGLKQSGRWVAPRRARPDPAARFPFTPFVLAAGALEVKGAATFFFVTLGRLPHSPLRRRGGPRSGSMASRNRGLVRLGSVSRRRAGVSSSSRCCSPPAVRIGPGDPAQRARARPRRPSSKKHSTVERGRRVPAPAAPRRLPHSGTPSVRDLGHVRTDLLRWKVHDGDDQTVQERIFRIVLSWPAPTTS